MTILVFGLLGLIIGSFLNVIVLRKGARPITGRSSCMSCGYTLHWYDLIPIVSWLALRGRCRKCGSCVSIQYPLVEASTAILFALLAPISIIGFSLPFPIDILFVLDYLAIVAFLVAIAAYDFLHTIIPDGWAYSFGALAFVSQLLTPLPIDFPWMQFFLAGPIAASPLFFLWLVSGGRWMGLGDAKLSLGIGWLLGPIVGLEAVMFSFILGTVILVPLMLAERAITHMRGFSVAVRGLTMKSEVPFGPFLILSCLIFWFAQLYGVQLPLPF
ncbi:prepilin peptidase [Candidatus Kaiserbacteria bacterium]|nr:prepilin peptidase [Candidatus Kaiserbacteria bacterium]